MPRVSAPDGSFSASFAKSFAIDLPPTSGRTVIDVTVRESGSDEIVNARGIEISIP
jgi:hypothetical protein